MIYTALLHTWHCLQYVFNLYILKWVINGSTVFFSVGTRRSLWSPRLPRLSWCKGKTQVTWIFFTFVLFNLTVRAVVLVCSFLSEKYPVYLKLPSYESVVCVAGTKTCFFLSILCCYLKSFVKQIVSLICKKRMTHSSGRILFTCFIEIREALKTALSLCVWKMREVWVIKV